MVDYDSDDTNVELLIRYCSLDALLQFVVARDDVRRIRAPLQQRDELDEAPAQPCAPTMRAAAGYVAISSIVKVA